MIRDVVARKWTKGRTGGQTAFEIRSLGSTNIWLLWRFSNSYVTRLPQDRDADLHNRIRPFGLSYC